jgi:hypothetical protein
MGWSWIGKVGRVWKAGPVSRWWNGSSKASTIFIGTAQEAFERGVRHGSRIASKAGAAAGKVSGWAKGAYMALGAGVSFWVFGGGLVGAVSGALGVPEWAASCILTVAAVILIGLAIYLAYRWAASRLGVRPAGRSLGTASRGVRGGDRRARRR